MSTELSGEEKMLVSINEVRFIAWNPDKGKLLEAMRGKKSRRQLAEEIKTLGGACSQQNLKYLEYGLAEMVSVEVLQSICLALDTHISKFVELYCLRFPTPKQ